MIKQCIVTLNHIHLAKSKVIDKTFTHYMILLLELLDELKISRSYENLTTFSLNERFSHTSTTNMQTFYLR